MLRNGRWRWEHTRQLQLIGSPVLFRSKAVLLLMLISLWALHEKQTSHEYANNDEDVLHAPSMITVPCICKQACVSTYFEIWYQKPFHWSWWNLIGRKQYIPDELQYLQQGNTISWYPKFQRCWASFDRLPIGQEDSLVWEVFINTRSMVSKRIPDSLSTKIQVKEAANLAEVIAASLVFQPDLDRSPRAHPPERGMCYRFTWLHFLN